MGSNPESRPEAAFVSLANRAFASIDERLTAGEAVAQLLAHPGWAHVSRLVDAERARVDRKLDGALLPTRADYAREHGRRSGLRAFEEAARAIVAVAERELDRQQSKHERAADAALLEVSR